MSQTIEGLKSEVGLVRFSVLSDKKIQLEYKVPIFSQELKIDSIKVKFRYEKEYRLNLYNLKHEDSWSLIPINERFFNKISMSYGIKKSKIKCKIEKKVGNFDSNENITIVVKGVEYNINSLIKKFIFNDIKWHRNFIISKFY